MLIQNQGKMLFVVLLTVLCLVVMAMLIAKGVKAWLELRKMRELPAHPATTPRRSAPAPASPGSGQVPARKASSLQLPLRTISAFGFEDVSEHGCPRCGCHYKLLVPDGVFECGIVLQCAKSSCQYRFVVLRRASAALVHLYQAFGTGTGYVQAVLTEHPMRGVPTKPDLGHTVLHVFLADSARPTLGGVMP